MTDQEKPSRDVVEEMMVAGGELVARVKQLVAEGNVRRIIVEKESGEKLLELPVTLGAGFGAAAALLSPMLAGLAGAALLLSRARVKVVRAETVVDAREELQTTSPGGQDGEPPGEDPQ